MDQVNKDTLISLQVEKAKRFLTQADEMVELKHWDLAANRYYYACFHAVQALFIAKGVNAHTHVGINTQFSLHFVFLLFFLDHKHLLHILFLAKILLHL